MYLVIKALVFSFVLSFFLYTEDLTIGVDRWKSINPGHMFMKSLWCHVVSGSEAATQFRIDKMVSANWVKEARLKKIHFKRRLAGSYPPNLRAHVVYFWISRWGVALFGFVSPTNARKIFFYCQENIKYSIHGTSGETVSVMELKMVVYRMKCPCR